jgi:hypothetical protein
VAGPTVTLTFAGDAKPATTALDQVGDAAEDMDSRVTDSTAGLDSAGEGFDDAEGKAQGFNDTLSGVTDTMGGVGQMASGDMLGGIMTLGGGLADLAGGISAFVIPVFGKIIAATWAWTAALLANPITWIVLGIIALIAVIVLLIVYWDEIAAATGKAFDWMKDKAAAGFDWIKEKALALVGWFKGLPGRIRSAASGMWDGIKDSFRSAVNWLIDKWNGFQLTLGGGSVMGYDIPSVTLNTPNVPRFHTGTSSVPGAPGSEMLAILQAGERVTSAGAAHEQDRRGGGTITFAGPEAILAMLRQMIVSKGGVDVVFRRS